MLFFCFFWSVAEKKKLQDGQHRRDVTVTNSILHLAIREEQKGSGPGSRVRHVNMVQSQFYVRGSSCTCHFDAARRGCLQRSQGGALWEHRYGVHARGALPQPDGARNFCVGRVDAAH